MIIRDKFNEHTLYNFTEQEYLNYLYNEGRCNISYIDDKIRPELVLVIGRRGTKCCWENSYITTTEGTITYGELYDRFKKGEKIGLFTYDENWNKFITYDIIVDDNDYQITKKIITSMGRSEIVTLNHPYYVWRDEWYEPQWVECKDLKIGDKIAIASSQCLFGNISVGIPRIEMLAHLYGTEKNAPRHKKIPDVIKKAPKNEVKLFLNILFNYISYVEMRKDRGVIRGEINFFYPYPEFLTDIQRELLKFGVIARITKNNDKTSSYYLAISNKDNIIKFAEEININGREGEVKKLVDFYANKKSVNFYAGLPGSSRKRLKESANKILAQKLIDSKIYWDSIKEINSTGNLRTIALEVKDTNIIGNDIISHNSTISSWIAVYETYRLLKIYHPQKHFGLLPDAEIQLTTIATTEDQANTLFRQILGHFSQCNYYHRYINKPLNDKVLIRSRRDLEKYGDEGKASIIVRSSPCSARAMRGVGNLLVIMDEQAHFVDEKTQSNKSDKSVYDAITPSVANFKGEGRIINISSPLTKSGVLWDLHNLALEGAEHLLLIKAPSWEINQNLPSDFLRARYKADPITYDCEFGGEFSDRIKSWMPEEYLRKIIIPDLKPKKTGVTRVPHFVGLDIGFKGDGTAIAVTHVVQVIEDDKKIDKIELDFIEARYAGEPPYENMDMLDFELIADWIGEVCNKYFVVRGLLDQHNGVLVSQNLAKRHLPQFDLIYHTRNFNSELYQNLMMLTIDRKLRIFNERPNEFSDSDLINELLKLQVKQHSKNIIEVESPKIKGCHDDLSDALARSVWLAAEAMRTGMVSGSLATANTRYTHVKDSNQYQMVKTRLHNITDNRRNIRQNRTFNWMHKYGK